MHQRLCGATPPFILCYGSLSQWRDTANDHSYGRHKGDVELALSGGDLRAGLTAN